MFISESYIKDYDCEEDCIRVVNILRLEEIKNNELHHSDVKKMAHVSGSWMARKEYFLSDKEGIVLICKIHDKCSHTDQKQMIFTITSYYYFENMY